MVGSDRKQAERELVMVLVVTRAPLYCGSISGNPASRSGSVPQIAQHNHDELLLVKLEENESENNQWRRLDGELPLGLLILSINL